MSIVTLTYHDGAYHGWAIKAPDGIGAETIRDSRKAVRAELDQMIRGLARQCSIVRVRVEFGDVREAVVAKTRGGAL